MRLGLRRRKLWEPGAKRTKDLRWVFYAGYSGRTSDGWGANGAEVGSEWVHGL